MNFVDKKLALLVYARAEVDKLDNAVDYTEPFVKIFTIQLYLILKERLALVDTEAELADFVESTIWQATMPGLETDLFDKEKMTVDWDELEVRKLDYIQADLIINWLKGLFGVLE